MAVSEPAKTSSTPKSTKEVAVCSSAIPWMFFTDQYAFRLRPYSTSSCKPCGDKKRPERCAFDRAEFETVTDTEAVIKLPTCQACEDDQNSDKTNQDSTLVCVFDPKEQVWAVPGAGPRRIKLPIESGYWHNPLEQWGMTTAAIAAGTNKEVLLVEHQIPDKMKNLHCIVFTHPDIRCFKSETDRGETVFDRYFYELNIKVTVESCIACRISGSMETCEIRLKEFCVAQHDIPPGPIPKSSVKGKKARESLSSPDPGPNKRQKQKTLKGRKNAEPIGRSSSRINNRQATDLDEDGSDKRIDMRIGNGKDIEGRMGDKSKTGKEDKEDSQTKNGKGDNGPAVAINADKSKNIAKGGIRRADGNDQESEGDHEHLSQAGAAHLSSSHVVPPHPTPPYTAMGFTNLASIVMGDVVEMVQQQQKRDQTFYRDRFSLYESVQKEILSLRAQVAATEEASAKLKSENNRLQDENERLVMAEIELQKDLEAAQMDLARPLPRDAELEKKLLAVKRQSDLWEKMCQQSRKEREEALRGKAELELKVDSLTQRLGDWENGVRTFEQD